MINRKIFHIAAVSMIEIMMIFTIIGIVTGACVSLNKPKNEYMRKIKIYSAYMALDAAGKNIATETHLDFTTDVNTCTTARSNNICTQYTTTDFPGLSGQLPKVVTRASENSSVVDPGLTSNTPYSSLNAVRMEQFKYLQSGLCQRLAKTFNIPDSGINCATDINSPTLVQSAYPASFRTETPQLYLPNGQVIYLNNSLRQDFRTNGGTIYQYVISASGDTGRTHENNLLVADNKCTNLNSAMTTLKNGTSYPNSLAGIPNETRKEALKIYLNSCTPLDNGTAFAKYWQKMWEKNKDYFIIYIDTNCKMADDNDKQCGPDRLNQDVFAFRMYRDGSVLPDYRSGFPLTVLTAKMLVKDQENPNGDYEYMRNEYSLKPLVYSRCYANLAGSYASGHPIDNIGICSFGGNTKAPIANCITATEDSICKSVVNKPSFFVR